MKKVIALLFLLVINSFFQVEAKPFDGKLYYSEATDVFNLMDHVSNFRFNKLPIYRQQWERKFPISLEEQNLFKRYIQLRHKYYKSRKLEGFDQNKLLFTHQFIPQFDFIADCFYTSRSVAEAFKKLRKKLKPEELKFLTTFYKHFQKKIGFFLKESTQFSQKLKALNKEIKKYKLQQTIKKMANFLGVAKRNMQFNMQFVWWPSEQGPLVTYGHNVVLLHYNPISQTDAIDIKQIAEMVMRAVIYRMPFNLKQNLSKRFFQECKPQGINYENILERPLMVLAGAIYAEKNIKKKKEFNLFEHWDDNPWVNAYVKMIFPALEQAFSRKENISVSFIQNAAAACSELVTLSKYMK